MNLPSLWNFVAENFCAVIAYYSALTINTDSPVIYHLTFNYSNYATIAFITVSGTEKCEIYSHCSYIIIIGIQPTIYFITLFFSTSRMAMTARLMIWWWSKVKEEKFTDQNTTKTENCRSSLDHYEAILHTIHYRGCCMCPNNSIFVMSEVYKRF